MPQPLQSILGQRMRVALIGKGQDKVFIYKFVATSFTTYIPSLGVSWRLIPLLGTWSWNHGQEHQYPFITTQRPTPGAARAGLFLHPWHDAGNRSNVTEEQFSSLMAASGVCLNILEWRKSSYLLDLLPILLCLFCHPPSIFEILTKLYKCPVTRSAKRSSSCPSSLLWWPDTRRILWTVNQESTDRSNQSVLHHTNSTIKGT